VRAAGISHKYDNNGNLSFVDRVTTGTSGAAWYADNRPKQLTKSNGSESDRSTFQYTPSGRRWSHIYQVGSASGGAVVNWYINLGDLYDKNGTQQRFSVYANGDLVAVRTKICCTGSSTDDAYILRDHLGSTDVITYSDGTVRRRESFDAFGKRRGQTWTGDLTPTDLQLINAVTRRGFTSHEHLDSTDLIHMNGRVYDPVIGRFISPDPGADCGLDTQSWNRYSYVRNNPLRFTDPSGYSRFLGDPHNNGGGGLAEVKVVGSRSGGGGGPSGSVRGLFGGAGPSAGGAGHGGGGRAPAGGNDEAPSEDQPDEEVVVTGTRPADAPMGDIPNGLVNIGFPNLTTPGLSVRDRSLIDSAAQNFDDCVGNCTEFAKDAFIDPAASVLGGAADGGLVGALGGAVSAGLDAGPLSDAAENATAARLEGQLDGRSTEASRVRRGRSVVGGAIANTATKDVLGPGVVGTSAGYIADGYVSGYLESRFGGASIRAARAAGGKGAKGGVRGAAASAAVTLGGGALAEAVCSYHCSQDSED